LIERRYETMRRRTFT